jgi:hypothetical protein
MGFRFYFAVAAVVVAFWLLGLWLRKMRKR